MASGSLKAIQPSRLLVRRRQIHRSTGSPQKVSEHVKFRHAQSNASRVPAQAGFLVHHGKEAWRTAKRAASLTIGKQHLNHFMHLELKQANNQNEAQANSKPSAISSRQSPALHRKKTSAVTPALLSACATNSPTAGLKVCPSSHPSLTSGCKQNGVSVLNQKNTRLSTFYTAQDELRLRHQDICRFQQQVSDAFGGSGCLLEADLEAAVMSY